MIKLVRGLYGQQTGFVHSVKPDVPLPNLVRRFTDYAKVRILRSLCFVPDFLRTSGVVPTAELALYESKNLAQIRWAGTGRKRIAGCQRKVADLFMAISWTKVLVLPGEQE